MTLYTYSRFSPRNPDFQRNKHQLQTDFPDAVHIEESARTRMDPLQRPDFAKLLETLQPGDIVVVTWLASISRDFQLCRQAIEQLLDKQVTVQTHRPPLAITPGSETAVTVLTMLHGSALADTRYRLDAAELSRQALREDPQAWQSKFRGRPADKQKHQQIAALLLEGKTLEDVAQRCQCSLSTVKRVKSKIRAHDDAHALRQRHNKHSDT